MVARAFDRVHGEAVRLAGNEAMLRGSLNAMFISLSRRSVPLIERLARKIDSLEQNEDDPGRLSSLFSMDHLVTRMRRNSENLLVLAGEEPVRKWSDPVPLTDVARAATSEIEQYIRVALDIQSQVTVSGQAASDVVHLLAEIIENATRFSPRDTPVHVSGHECGSGGVLLEVRDNGVGLSAARLAEMNDRLDTPPEIDVSVSRHMGLFAVSRLATRHGIKVRLRSASPQGLSALVWLPGSLTGRAAARPAGSDGHHASDPVTAIAPVSAVAPSNWFRAGRASTASAGSAWVGGWQTTETVSALVLGDQTAAGLPSRLPGANRFSGSAASAASKAWGPGETPAISPRQPSRGTEAAAPARPVSPRSAQQARNRLGGFQLGGRQAEGRASSEGERS